MEIYLAGPIRYSEDPHTWREELSEEYDHEFLNPLDWGDHTESDDPAPPEVVDQDIAYLRYDADAILCRWEPVETAGTPMELVYASEIYEIPVVVWNPYHGDLSPWVEAHADKVVEYVEDGMSFLEGVEYATS